MMRNRTAAPLLLAFALAAGACSAEGAAGTGATAPTEAPVPSPTVTEQGDPEPQPLEPFSTEAAMGHVRRLARGIGIRVRGTDGERRGARYIRRKLEAMGYDVRIQKFQVDGGLTSRNVVASWPGAKPFPLVIGAHMDSVPGSPGANDNASGVAVVLEMARIFAGRRQANLVKFVAFGSEEYGTDGTHHVGSRVFVRRLGPRGRSRLAGMVSVDMIADGRPLIVGNSGISHAVVARTLYNKIDRAGFSVAYRTLCDCSDNGPFERAGIPASFAWSGPEPDYHSASDRVANMKKADLRRSGRAMRVFIRSVNKRMLERFRSQNRA